MMGTDHITAATDQWSVIVNRLKALNSRVERSTAAMTSAREKMVAINKTSVDNTQVLQDIGRRFENMEETLHTSCQSLRSTIQEGCAGIREDSKRTLHVYNCILCVQ